MQGLNAYQIAKGCTVYGLIASVGLLAVNLAYSPLLLRLLWMVVTLATGAFFIATLVLAILKYTMKSP